MTIPNNDIKYIKYIQLPDHHTHGKLNM